MSISMSALIVGLAKKNAGLANDIFQSGFDEVFYYHVKDDNTSANLLMDISPDIIVVLRGDAGAAGVRNLLNLAGLMMIPVSIS